MTHSCYSCCQSLLQHSMCYNALGCTIVFLMVMQDLLYLLEANQLYKDSSVRYCCLVLDAEALSAWHGQLRGASCVLGI